MLFLASTLVLSLVLGASARPETYQNPLNTQQTDSCATGAHIVGVRATTESPGFGKMQDIVDLLLPQIPDSDSYPIVYPAAGINITTKSYNLTLYRDSELKGYQNLTAHLQSYTTACPETRIVLLGYSQGAHVVGDALCGWAGGFPVTFPTKIPIADPIKNQISAVIQLGDPTNRADISWHVGTSTGIGIFRRPSIQQCGDVTGRWQSYCDAHDPFCSVSSDPDVNVHLQYVPKYKAQIVQYIVDKFNEPSDTSYEL